jgi:DNA-binding transcriptional LysR family regulator
VDLIIVPDVFRDARATCTNVGRVENVWMCKPGLVGSDRPLQLRELAEYPLLSQGELSGTGLTYNRWLQDQGVETQHNLKSSSLVALVGLIISGMGVSYLPRDCFSAMVAEGRLQTLRVNPPLPETLYVAMHRTDQRSNLVAAIVMLAQSCCDFTRLFQGAEDDRPAVARAPG